MPIPLVTEADLETLPEGLYRLGDTAIGLLYDSRSGEMVNARLQRFARVRNGGSIPDGCEVKVRTDGMMIVIQAGVIEACAQE